VKRWLALGLVALAGAAGVLATGAVARVGGGAPFISGPSGVFVAVCGFTHRNHDDSIVFPNQPGASHEHTYFGNPSANANSTLESLLASETTCNFLGDTAAYWVPTLFDSGRAVEPYEARVAYVKGTFGKITPFPPGLKVVAGDAKATSPQSLRVTSWNCAARSSSASSSIKPCGAALVLQVNFPNCWNGRDLDSADHKSHMAYSINRTCPATHPVAVPELQYVVVYPPVSAAAELSSGGQFSAHADFINAWNQRQLVHWVNIYLNLKRR
jgi:hypothetical protein